MTLMNTTLLKIGNSITVQRLVAKYLGPVAGTQALNGVTISARPIGNRTGVKGQTFRYEIRGEGWEMQVRAAWDGDRLLTPLATHCVVAAYSPTTDDSVRDANRWLRSLDI